MLNRNIFRFLSIFQCKEFYIRMINSPNCNPQQHNSLNFHQIPAVSNEDDNDKFISDSFSKNFEFTFFSYVLTTLLSFRL